MEATHDRLQSSSMRPAKVTRRLSSQMNPPRPSSPDRLLLLLWRTLDFAPHPCHRCPLGSHGFLRSSDCDCIDDTQETHWVVCPYPSVNVAPDDSFLTLLANKQTNKRKRLLRGALHSLGRWNWTKEKPMSVSDRTLTKQKEVPFKKNIVDWNLEGGKAREIKSITISSPSLGSKWRKKIYCILL